jgi:hypothetical protein
MLIRVPLPASLFMSTCPLKDSARLIIFDIPTPFLFLFTSKPFPSSAMTTRMLPLEWVRETVMFFASAYLTMLLICSWMIL